MKNQPNIEDYFQKLRNPHSEPFNHSKTLHAQILVSQANAGMVDHLLNGIENISSNQSPYNLNYHKNNQEEYTQTLNLKNQLRNIQDRKHRMKKQLEKLLCEEDSVNIDISLSQVRQNKRRIETRSVRHRMGQRSELTFQDKQKLKKLIKSQRKFEKHLEFKTKQFYNSIERKQKLREKRQQTELQTIKKKRRLQALKNIDEKNTEKEKEIQKMKEWSAKMRKILKKKQLHEEMKESWKIRENQDEEKKIQKIKELRRNRAINFSDIHEHERRYNEALIAQKQSRAKCTLTQPSHESVSKIFASQSPFLSRIFEEEKQTKQEEEIKKKQIQALVEKRYSYGQQIRKNYLPKVKNQSKFIEAEQNKQNSMLALSKNGRVRNLSNSRVLNVEEMHKQGVEFMRSANALNYEKVKKNGPKITEQLETKSKYRNYLAQQRHKKGDSSLRKKSDIQQIKQIMKFKSLTNDQKFYKAKILADKIEQNDYYPKSKVLVDSISAKLQILKQLSED